MNVELTQSANIENGCAQEGCFAATDGEYACPGNSSCEGDINGGDVTCTCHLGYRGDDCSEGVW